MRLFIKFALSGLAIISMNSLFAQDELVAQGEQVFLARCEYCHGDGPQKGATLTLGQRYQGTNIPALLSERTDLAPEYIRVMVRTNTNGMTPIRITEVDEQQLDALIAYLTRNNP